MIKSHFKKHSIIVGIIYVVMVLLFYIIYGLQTIGTRISYDIYPLFPLVFIFIFFSISANIESDLTEIFDRSKIVFFLCGILIGSSWGGVIGGVLGLLVAIFYFIVGGEAMIVGVFLGTYIIIGFIFLGFGMGVAISFAKIVQNIIRVIRCRL